MKLNIINLFIYIILFTSFLSAEDLSGRIADKATGNPLPNVVIWLKNILFKDISFLFP